MTTTRKVHGIGEEQVLFAAFELSQGFWKLAFGRNLGDHAWIRQVNAGDREAVLKAIAKARERFGLDTSVPVVSCYEAGRDGFWVHRWLLSVGIDNHVMDSSSIEVSRRQRRAKTDELDAQSLLRVLIRKRGGEEKACRFVVPPAAEDEDRRQLHRGRQRIQTERTALINQIKGKLTLLGLDLKGSDVRLTEAFDREAFDREAFVRWLDEARDWQGKPIGPELRELLRMAAERLELASGQLRELEARQRESILDDKTPQTEKMRRLLMLKGIGFRISWVLVQEVFGWRTNLTRKQLGSLAGLTPTPYDSGKTKREQGISKAGNRRLRQTLVELAWLWLRHQPNTALSKWYWSRFGQGRRQRKIGIVALARKLFVALYRLVERDELPQGAATVEWQTKVKRPRRSSGTALEKRSSPSQSTA